MGDGAKQLGILQAMEQMGAFVRDFAPVVYRYYEALTEAGFSEDQALRLTVEWQNATMMMSAVRRSDPQDGA